jgi:hypothetical protein
MLLWRLVRHTHEVREYCWLPTHLVSSEIFSRQHQLLMFLSCIALLSRSLPCIQLNPQCNTSRGVLNVRKHKIAICYLDFVSALRSSLQCFPIAHRDPPLNNSFCMIFSLPYSLCRRNPKLASVHNQFLRRKDDRKLLYIEFKFMCINSNTVGFPLFSDG